MKNKNITIYLNTPLIDFDPRIFSLEGVNRIVGKVIDLDDAGIQVEVKALGNDKVLHEKPEFKELFIPMHKIDFIAVV